MCTAVVLRARQQKRHSGLHCHRQEYRKIDDAMIFSAGRDEPARPLLAGRDLVTLLPACGDLPGTIQLVKAWSKNDIAHGTESRQEIIKGIQEVSKRYPRGIQEVSKRHPRSSLDY